MPGTPAGSFDRDGLFVAAAERGISRVGCFSPRHRFDGRAHERAGPHHGGGRMGIAIHRLVSREPGIQHVQIFENRGAMMGASNPHPHSQIWASSSIPTEAAAELRQQAAWLAGRGSCLLCDYLKLERESGERLVCENESFAALVPFWAVWPFETMVISKRHLRTQWTNSMRPSARAWPTF